MSLTTKTFNKKPAPAVHEKTPILTSKQSNTIQDVILEYSPNKTSLVNGEGEKYNIPSEFLQDEPEAYKIVELIGVTMRLLNPRLFEDQSENDMYQPEPSDDEDLNCGNGLEDLDLPTETEKISKDQEANEFAEQESRNINTTLTISENKNSENQGLKGDLQKEMSKNKQLMQKVGEKTGKYHLTTVL